MKRNNRKPIGVILLALLLVCTLLYGGCASTRAAGTYSDVANGAWYAEAVNALREKNLMNGVGNDAFDPNGVFTRAQLATVLYRMAGNPGVTGEDSFTDTVPGAWYSDAVLWSEQNSIVGGYGDGRFGTNDPTTQEQLAVMLWRDAGSYVTDSREETGASAWAVDAVRWLKAEKLLNENAPAFSPKDAATRAQVADVVYRYLQLKERYPDAVSGATKKDDAPGQTGTAGGKILIAYFSRTGENYNVGVISEGNTAKFAKEIAAQTGGDLFEIVPVNAYPSAYSEMLPIATDEKNSDARPAIRDSVQNFADYDTVFLGYPIWWGDLPMILHTFMESYDFTGKTVIPFNTHEGSGQSGTQSEIAKKLSGATVLQGLAIRGSVAQGMTGDGSDAAVKNWLDGLGFSKKAAAGNKVGESDLTGKQTEEAAVLAAYQAVQQAMIDKDISTLDRIILDVTTFTHMSGKTQTKAEYFADIRDGRLNYQSYTMENTNVIVDGDKATLTSHVVLTANAYGAQGSWPFDVTAHLVLIDGEWRLTN